jgi:hypothetical protein
MSKVSLDLFEIGNFIVGMINESTKPGYGRNAQIFKDKGISVTGIEISKTAIEMARKHYGTDMIIGKFISNDRYEIFDGVKMFFYDRESINAEF